MATPFKVPTRKPGIIEVELGDVVRKIDVYRALDLYELITEQVIEEAKGDDSIPLKCDVLTRWAAALFKQSPSEWCPESAAALWTHVKGVVDELKKSGLDSAGQNSLSFTAPTVSPQSPPLSNPSGLESPST